MADDGRRGLGRGLAALIGEVDGEPASIADRSRASRKLPIELVTPNPRNPRKAFDSAGLEELAASVREKGIVQPILVRPTGREGRYEIIAGERRWRAAQRAGLHDVPVIVHEANDEEALELALVENVQRTNLNPMEEATGYLQLMDAFAYTPADLVEVIGKSRPHIANTLRLLKLPDTVQAYVREGALSAGHARALVNAPDPEAAARRIIEEGLSVRGAEALVAAPARAPRRRAGSGKDADTLAFEKSLSDAIGLKVLIEHKPDGSGELRIRYTGLDQLDDLCRRLQTS